MDTSNSLIEPFDSGELKKVVPSGSAVISLLCKYLQHNNTMQKIYANIIIQKCHYKINFTPYYPLMRILCSCVLLQDDIETLSGGSGIMSFLSNTIRA